MEKDVPYIVYESEAARHERDAKNEQVMALERQLAMANLAASQTAQTAEIISKLPAATTTA